MIRRKQYLYSASKMPRTTLYRRKLRERSQREFQKRHDISNSDAASTPVQVNADQTISAHPPVVETSGKSEPVKMESSDSDSDDSLSSASSSFTVTEVDDCAPTNDLVDVDDGGPLLRTDSSIAEQSLNDGTSDEDMESSLPSDDVDSDEGEDEAGGSYSSHESEEDNGSAGFPNLQAPCADEENSDFQEGFDATPLADRSQQSVLCQCTNTTEGDALLMTMALGLRHSFTWAALVDTLELVNHLYGRKVVKASKYYFQKYMDAGKQQTMKYHLYCSYCQRYLGTKESHGGKQNIVCVCGHEIRNINHATTYFLSLGLGEQIKDFLKDKEFVDALGYRFERKKEREEAYEDIFDGEVYRSLSASGQVLSKRYNFSYTFNSDGFPVGGKSGKQHCWPIYVRINELPPKLRSKYIMLAGISVGPNDPNMRLFLHPFVEEANSLSSVGINWYLDGKEINSKVIPICICADSPARAKLLNMAQHNGYYGCTVCNCLAETISKRLYYTVPPRGVIERTHTEILVNAAEAHANITIVRNKKKRSVKGVKGWSPIHMMAYLPLVKGVRPDIMHSKFLGNVKNHTFKMLDSCGKPYYIGSDIIQNAINSRLLAIKPPSSVMRPPRSIHNANLWKAKEWRSWVLFFVVVCLHGVIPDEYVIHFSMLSTAVHIILQKTISQAELELAQMLLYRYVFEFQQIFGKLEMVFNLHLLLHTKRSVECLGPAWTHTAFGFEAANKTLGEMQKNPFHVAKEMARKYLAYKAFPTLVNQCASSEHTVKFCEKLSGRPLKSFHRLGRVILVGNGNILPLDVEERSSLQNFDMSILSEALSFQRMIYDGIRFCSSSYTRSEKFDDSFVNIRGETKGRIQKICKISKENNSKVIIFVREFILDENPIFSDEFGRHCKVKRILSEGQLFVIRPEDISAQCVAMFIENGKFICDMPYGCYHED